MTAFLKKSILGLLKTSIFLLSFFLFNSLKAQTGNPIPGYTYLGQCQGHYFYVSDAAVSWPAANTAATGLGGYLATLTSQAENDCVWDFYRNLLIGTTGLVNYTVGTTGEYDDDRHAWIGLTDITTEGTWVWNKADENCNDFRNWDQGEPNNFDNDEDYAVMLAFNRLIGPGQGGKWNDWYNVVVDPTGNPVTQRYIVEFGPTRCPVVRGDEGCSHGYWKSASKKWWFGNVGVGAAGYKRGDNFFTTFGINTGNPANLRGLSAGLTLDGALNTGGGGYNNVARQGVAALLNAADPDVNYPYTEGEIKFAMKSMFETGSAQLPDPNTNYTTMGTYNVNQLGELLDWANNLGCPINAHGNRTEMINGEEMTLSLSELSIKALPNPSSGAFNIQFNSGSTEKITLQVMDMQGKLIERRENVLSNQTIQIGQNYNAGVYFIDVMQGTVRKNLRLVKTK